MSIKFKVSLLTLALSSGLSAQPSDRRPPEPAPAQPPARVQKIPSTSPQREAVFLFQEGQRLHREGALLRAIDAYRKALNKDPGRLEYRPYLAVALDQVERYPEALEQFDLYLVREPGDARIRLERVATLIHSGDYNQAASQLDSLKLYGSGSAIYHNLVGLLALRQNRPGDAVSAFQTVLAQDGSRIDARINLAHAYLLMGDAEKSKEQLDLALKSGPKQIVLNNLGVLRGRAGDLASAQKLFEQAAGSQADPTSPIPQVEGIDKQALLDSLFNLATVLAQQNKSREALLTVARLLDIQSDHVDGQILYARLLARAGRLGEARKEIDKVYGLGPETLGTRWPYVAEISGLIYLRQDENELARADLEKAVLARPNSVSARHNLAMALGRLGSLEDAVAEELAASKLDPENKAIWYHLGVLYDLEARPKLAIQAYQRFLELAPDDPEAEGLKEHVAELEQQLSGKRRR